MLTHYSSLEIDSHLSRSVTSITKHTPTIRTEALSDRCQLSHSNYDPTIDRVLYLIAYDGTLQHFFDEWDIK
jgi:hypothetical protein